MRNTKRFFLRAAGLLLTLAPMLALAQLCTGLCLQQVTCASPAVTTAVSGTVYAPNGVDPLPGVLVYVPNAPVEALPSGATCRSIVYLRLDKAVRDMLYDAIVQAKRA